MFMVEILIIVVVLALVAITGIVPHRSSLSEFELRRRLDNKTHGTLIEWQRGELYSELMTIRRVAVAFLLVLASALIISKYGWVWGLVLAFMLTLLYNRIANFGLVRVQAQRLYDTYETRLLGFIDRRRGWIRPFRSVTDVAVEHKVSSREELEHLVGQAKFLSGNERKTLASMLHFEGKLVRDYMTPRSVMEAIGVHELLGPLVLDGLHKTGHSHFPVFEGDIDHIVGMLHIHTLFHLHDKHSRTVQDVMEPKVLYIHEEQTLGQALAACIKHRRHLLIVINEFRETVGVITIEDAVEQLIGRKIVDEFQAHDDLRAVAARNPRANNKSTHALDV